MEVHDGKREADLQREIDRLEREIHGMRMGLRDQFAMASLTGYMTSINGWMTPERESAIARNMFSMADAMLTARREGQ